MMYTQRHTHTNLILELAHCLGGPLLRAILVCLEEARAPVPSLLLELRDLQQLAPLLLLLLAHLALLHPHCVCAYVRVRADTRGGGRGESEKSASMWMNGCLHEATMFMPATSCVCVHACACMRACENAYVFCAHAAYAGFRKVCACAR